MTAKLKIGDKVEILECATKVNCPNHKGKIGVLKEIDDDYYLIEVEPIKPLVWATKVRKI